MSTTTKITSKCCSSWNDIFDLYMSLIIVCTILGGIFFYLLTRTINHIDKDSQEKRIVQKKITPHTSVNMTQAIKTLWSNNYLFWIAFSLLSYQITVNVSEIVWNEHITQLYSEKADIQSFISSVTSNISISSIFLGMLLPILYPFFGWTVSALSIPIASILFLVMFFGSILLNSSIDLGNNFEWVSFIVMVGGYFNIFLRSTKYSIYDPLKELCLTVIPIKQQLEGKLIIDTIVSRLGKIAGAIIFLTLHILIGYRSFANKFVLFLFLLLIVVLWAYATIYTGITYKKKKHDLEK